MTKMASIKALRAPLFNRDLGEYGWGNPSENTRITHARFQDFYTLSFVIGTNLGAQSVECSITAM